MSGIKLGKYYPVSSFPHEIHPVIKLICFFLFLYLIWSTKEINLQISYFLFLICIIILSKVPLKYYGIPIFRMKFLLLGVFFLSLFSDNRIIFFFLSFFQIVNLVILSMALLYTTKQREFLYGLDTIFSPLLFLKIPVRSMTMMVSLAFQLIPNLFLEMDKILKSLICRGLDYHDATTREKWEILKATITPMFVYTFRQTDQLSDIMELHGYEVEKKRTSYEVHSLKWTDYVLLCLFLSFVVVKVVFL